MAQMLILGKLPDSPPPHRMWLRIYMAMPVLILRAACFDFAQLSAFCGLSAAETCPLKGALKTWEDSFTSSDPWR
jgi:hypothetical protein